MNEGLMRISQTPFLVFALSSRALFAQDPSSLPVYQTKDIPSMGWAADSATVHTPRQAQTLSLQSMDVSVDSGGSAHLGYNEQASDWSPMGAGIKAVAWHSYPGMVQPATSVNRFKYRLGTYWLESQDNMQVQRWDETHHTWRTILQPGVEFSDFEVSSTGQIVLIRTFGTGRDHLFESFEQRGEKPVATVDLPSSGLTPAEAEQYYFYWDSFKACVCDEFIVAYAQDCGRMFVFDTSDGALHEMDTPWLPASGDWFRGQVQKYGVLNLDRFPGVSSLEFLPTGSRNAMQIAYQIPAKAPRKQVLVDGKPQMVKVGEDPAPSPVMVADLDFSTMSLKGAKPVDGASLPLWVREDGSLGPIKEVLASARKNLVGSTKHAK